MDSKLTQEEQLEIVRRTGWSMEVVRFIRNMDEARIYMGAGPVEVVSVIAKP